MTEKDLVRNDLSGTGTCYIEGTCIFKRPQAQAIIENNIPPILQTECQVF